MRSKLPFIDQQLELGSMEIADSTDEQLEISGIDDEQQETGGIEMRPVGPEPGR